MARSVYSEIRRTNPGVSEIKTWALDENTLRFIYQQSEQIAPCSKGGSVELLQTGVKGTASVFDLMIGGHFACKLEFRPTGARVVAPAAHYIVPADDRVEIQWRDTFVTVDTIKQLAAAGANGCGVMFTGPETSTHGHLMKYKALFDKRGAVSFGASRFTFE